MDDALNLPEEIMLVTVLVFVCVCAKLQCFVDTKRDKENVTFVLNETCWVTFTCAFES